MGKFIGRDVLLDRLEQVSRKSTNEIKGLKGEIEVGDILAEYLPDDTYIIAQPVIGKYEPDFLVISPRYGFRLIEVKNWSLNSIQNVQSNGIFNIVNKSYNPLQQVRKHVDDLKGYLISNHAYLSDPHKLIGYVTIQYGFNRIGIDKFTKDWDERHIIDFFTYHLFKDDLTSQLDIKLAFSTKFRYTGLQEKWIEDIVKNIRVSQEELSESEINFLIRSEEIDKTAQELKNLTHQAKQMIQEQQKSVSSKFNNESTQKVDEKVNENSGCVKNTLLFILVIVIIGLTILFLYLFSSDTNDSTESDVQELIDMPFEYYVEEYGAYTNSNIQDAFIVANNYVVTDATVLSFHFDNASGTKFLELEVEGFKLDAFIFKGTNTPYINENKDYRFYGITNEYNGVIELEIYGIKELE